jgi:hypothetical protein
MTTPFIGTREAKLNARSYAAELMQGDEPCTFDLSDHLLLRTLNTLETASAKNPLKKDPITAS